MIDLAAYLAALAARAGLVHGEENLQDAASELVSLLGDCPPQFVAQAVRILDQHWFQWGVGSATRALPLLRQTAPETALLFLAHPSGHVRERALQMLTGSLPSPFFTAALLQRLNDWVPQVRVAAVACAKRTLPLTSPHVLAPGLVAILVRARTWQRWGNERTLLDDTIRRGDVMQTIVDGWCQQSTGPQGRVLRDLLRFAEVDQYLWKSASFAIQPIVRAIAIAALVDGFANILIGTTWQWIDKPSGQRKRVPVFERRPVVTEVLPLVAARLGLQDSAAMVRRFTLDALARNRTYLPEAIELMVSLTEDPNPGVRERVAYWQKHRLEINK